MSVTDLFWLFFVFSALQPVLRQRMLEVMRTRKIAQLERKLTRLLKSSRPERGRTTIRFLPRRPRNSAYP